MISTLALFVGLLVSKERCHDFDCKLIKRLKHKCEISFDGSSANAFGVNYPMRQFMYGAKQGYHGQVDGNTLTLFFEGKRMTAYVAAYETKRDYDRWTCKF